MIVERGDIPCHCVVRLEYRGEDIVCAACWRNIQPVIMQIDACDAGISQILLGWTWPHRMDMGYRETLLDRHPGFHQL